jgi:vesicle-fusing ATPase
MNLVVSNLSNDLAKNNSVYISAQLAKDPSRTVNVRINTKILKCTFLPELDRTTIAMSKNLREFLGTDVGKNIRAEPLSGEFEEETGLSFLELEVNQVTPKLTGKAKLEDNLIIEQVRTREKGSFFNMGEVKYVPIEHIVYSVRTVKCMALLTGDNKKQSENNFGRLLPDTQVQVRAAEGSLIALQQTTTNETNIFRPDFRIEDMGIGGLDEELFNIFRRTFASRRYSAATLKRFGIKHVKGILLYGPPGTGKTLIARQLARALNVKDLKIVNGPEVFSKFVGES